MEVKTITLLNWLIKKYPNNADLGRELRRRMADFDFSMDKNDKKNN